MRVSALNLAFRTSMPTQAHSLVSMIVDDDGSNCKRGSCISGYRVEHWSLSDFGPASLKGNDPSCKVITGAARLQGVE